MTPQTEESRVRRAVALRIAGIAAVVALIAFWVWGQYFQTYHLATVQEGVLYRDGVRSMAEFDNACRSAKIKTVISLVDNVEFEQEPFSAEFKYCGKMKIKLLHVPVTLGGWPSNEQIQRFFKFATDQKLQPVLVHCAQGVRRTGMMVAAYQMSVLGYDKEKAKQAMLTFGHSERTVGDIKRFIDAYDPEKRELTVVLPPSRE